MASVDTNLVRRAFRSVYIPLAPVVPAEEFWQFENRNLNPTGLTFWGRETMLIGSEAVVASNLVCLSAILQLDLFVPKNTGTKVVEAGSKTILETLHPFRGITYETVQVAIDRAEPGTAISSGDWYQVPSFIYFRSYAFSNTNI